MPTEWFSRVNQDVALIWRACAGAASVLAVLTALGYAPSHLLCRGALRPYRWPLAPLLGWIVLTIGCYLLMTSITFGPALAIIAGVTLAADAALIFLGQSGLRVSSFEFRVGPLPEARNSKLETENAQAAPGLQRRRKPIALSRSEAQLVVAIALGSALVFLALLAPHVRHGSLALLVPNQDDEYFVDSVDYMWHTPEGLRLSLGGGRIETGWPYHLLVATFRPFTIVDDYEAMPLAGYLALALAVAPATLLFHRELRLPPLWAVAGAAISLLHGLTLWTPGYGFGPNAAGMAAAPLAFACVGRALRLRSAAALLLGGLALSFLVMAYTKVSIILYGTLGLGFGAALLAEVLAARSTQYSVPSTQHFRRLWRLPALWLLGAAFGAYAILDVVAWSVQQHADLLFGREVTTGAGWGWTDFPSLAVWAGTATWSLIGSALPPVNPPLGSAVTWSGTAAAALAIALGLWSIRRWRYRAVWGMLLGSALYYVYAREIKVFPYAVFKLYTLTAFLAVGLTLRAVYVYGAPLLRLTSRQAAAQSKIRGPAPAGDPKSKLQGLAGACALLYGLAFAANTWQTFRFYWQPWAPLLTPAALAEARVAVAAVPPGSTVFISGTFVTPVPPDQAAVRPHPIAYHSYWEALRSGADRLRGDIRHRLRQAGGEAAGVYARFSGGTADPRDRYDYLVLGAAEDPGFYGADESRRVFAGSWIALYRSAEGQALDVTGAGSLFDQASAGGPVRLSVACDGRLTAGDESPSLPVSPCGRATVTVALLPARPGPVAVRARTPAGEQDFPLYLASGLTWYRTPPLPLPAILSVAPEAQEGPEERGRVYVGGALATPVAAAAPADPLLRHVDGGAAMARLRAVAGEAILDVRYANGGALQNLRVTLFTEAVGPGKGFATDADVKAPFLEGRWRIAPGRAPEEQMSGRGAAHSLAGRWPDRPDADGQRWLRLVLQRAGVTWLEVPIGRIDVQGGRVVAVHPERTLFALPAPESVGGPPPPPPLPGAGTLVKGWGGEVFFVDGRALRWVPTVDVFQRRGFRWEAVQQVDDQTLRRWPLGIPLD